MDKIGLIVILALFLGAAVGYFLGALDHLKEIRKLKQIIRLQDKMHEQAVKDSWRSVDA